LSLKYIEISRYVPPKVLTSSRKVDEYKPLQRLSSDEESGEGDVVVVVVADLVRWWSSGF
jgi:hypothetical protein